MKGPVPASVHYKSSDREIAETFEHLLKEAQAHGGDGWRPVEGESQKVDPRWSPEFLRKPRNYFAGGGFGMEAIDYFERIQSAAHLAKLQTAARAKKFEGAAIPLASLSRALESYRRYVARNYGRFLETFDRFCEDPAWLGGPRASVEWHNDQQGPVPVSHASIFIAFRIVAMLDCLERYQAYHRLKPDCRIIEIGGGFGQLLGVVARFRRQT